MPEHVVLHRVWYITMHTDGCKIRNWCNLRSFLHDSLFFFISSKLSSILFYFVKTNEYEVVDRSNKKENWKTKRYWQKTVLKLQFNRCMFVQSPVLVPIIATYVRFHAVFFSSFLFLMITRLSKSEIVNYNSFDMFTTMFCLAHFICVGFLFPNAWRSL